MGLERLVLMLETLELNDTRKAVDVYLVTAGEGTLVNGMKLAEQLRESVPGLRLMTHFGGGNFKKQFKRADKVGATMALVLGENEVADQTIVVKDLAGGEQQTMPQADVAAHLANII